MWRRQAALAFVAGVVGLSGCGMYGWDRSGEAPGTVASVPASATAAPAGRPPSSLPGTAEAAAREAAFFAQAAHSGASEMELSRVVLERATQSSVKDFARTVLDDHRKVSYELTQLAQRVGVALPTVPTHQVEQKTETLQRIKAADVDRQYLSDMIADHIRAVNTFKDAARFAPDPRVRAWAAAQVPVLEKHLADAQRLSSGITTAAAQ